LTFQAKKNKIKAVVMHNSYSVQFNLRIFSKPSKEYTKWNSSAKHLVEFQRRSGDAFEFNAFFKQVMESIRKLDKSVILAETSSVTPRSLPESVSLPSSLAPPTLSQKVDVSLDAETRKALYSMAVATQNTEAQRESLRTLAGLSASAAASSFLTSQDLGDDSRKFSEEISLEQVLQCALTSRDHEVRRCASTLLANISRQESAQVVMSSTLIQKMFALLEQEHLDADDKPEAPLPEYVTAETKRQITRAISGLAQVPASCKAMASQPEYIRILRQQTERSDPRLAIYAQTALSKMPREVVV